MNQHIQHFWVVFRKDIRIELRTREILLTMGLFALLLVVVFSFAFYTDAERSRIYAPGILWTTVVFSGTIGLNRLFERENENGCLSGVLLTPISPRMVFVAKAMGNLLFTLLMEILTVPLLVMFFSLDIQPVGIFLSGLLLGTVGFCFVGTLFAAMLSAARMKEVLVPLVVYPIIVPIIIGGVKVTAVVLNDYPVEEALNWLKLIAGFDLLFVSLAIWLFEPMIAP
ncbi:MAG: heme exporter protein CcmB [Myxococcales bacterium]|nr:heme exporter protein CcmB [Myxococcales bacterium]